MSSSTSTKRWRVGLLVAVLLLAATLRFYRLGAQSFWNDEGNTARLVERSIDLIIEGAAGDIHPPGYYLLLHAWRAAVGESEFALRSFSAFCGILTVAVIAAIGQRIGGSRTAIGAALFAAVHPLAVYYGQEARMYALLGFVSTLTLWVATRLVEQHVGNRRLRRNTQHISQNYVLRFTLYTLSVALGLYTQYAYIFVLFGLNLAFGFYWLTHQPLRWRLLWTWIAAHALGGLLFAPWAPIALGASGWRPPDLDAAQALQSLARTLLVGITLPESRGNYVILVAAVLLLWSLLTRAHAGMRARSRFIKWAALGMALTPPALIFGLGIYRPAYLKFLMASVAPLGVVLSLPLGNGRSKGQTLIRLCVALLLFSLLPAQIASLRHLYTDPVYARDDYRGIATRIAVEGHPGDAILLSAPNQWEVFTYYYRGPLPVYPAPYRPTQAEATAWIDDIRSNHERLFVLFWGDTESDPERFIEPYLTQHAYKASDEWITSIRLTRYGTSALPDAPSQLLDARLGEFIVLEGYALPERNYTSGDIIPLTLFWRAEQTLDQRYKVFVHLINAEGALVAQADSEPGGGFALTTQWLPGEHISDRYGVYLPEDIPEGKYTLLAGMYGFAGERLSIARDGQSVGDALPLTELTVRSRR